MKDLLGDLPAAGQLGPMPALAAAATILASTVVGVMPASRIGDRPVRRVNFVESLIRPSDRRTTVGA
ncbi:putative fatty-acid synthase I [Mycobacterium kansasii 662]|uniref:Putative fatty-acid synthase I n=1 Tax=Mycobacterium kansasii 662 TaxID=1299326 RepID=X7XS44_MYCKA|nr:putative fatty-acid synthase I [Mycobacterium kansasii 662]